MLRGDWTLFCSYPVAHRFRNKPFIVRCEWFNSRCYHPPPLREVEGGEIIFKSKSKNGREHGCDQPRFRKIMSMVTIPNMTITPLLLPANISITMTTMTAKGGKLSVETKATE